MCVCNILPGWSIYIHIKDVSLIWIRSDTRHRNKWQSNILEMRRTYSKNLISINNFSIYWMEVESNWLAVNVICYAQSSVWIRKISRIFVCWDAATAFRTCSVIHEIRPTLQTISYHPPIDIFTCKQNEANQSNTASPSVLIIPQHQQLEQCFFTSISNAVIRRQIVLYKSKFLHT